jgi:hypothetical protein
MNSDYYQNEALLRDAMRTEFPNLRVIHDFHAKWLWQDKITVYFPQAKVGVEFSPDGHDPSLGRKWVTCKEHGIALYILLASDMEEKRFRDLRRMIDSRIKRKPKAVNKPRRK